MASDSTSKERPAVTKWRLPQVIDIKIRKISYQPPRLRYFKSYLSNYTSAVEFKVKTNGLIPIRALSPVLYVGDVPVTEMEQLKENLYRFLAFQFDRLKEDAEIFMAWPGQPKEEWMNTKFRYKLASDKSQESNR